MNIIAIHQPNYFPWLGYFSKILQSEIFIFLSDVQYSKNNYINRTRIRTGEKSAWLTVPVSVSLGDPICAVRPARDDWAEAHRNRLQNTYRSSPCFQDVWPGIQDMLQTAPATDLAEINAHLIRGIAAGLNLQTTFADSRDYETSGLKGDERLARLCRLAGAKSDTITYLSGKGGAKYQSPETFENAGVSLTYSRFRERTYPQGTDAFVPGQSILDALFQLGWDGVATLLRESVDGAAD